MKMYINTKEYIDTDIIAMTREQFTAEQIPRMSVVQKGKIYDGLTLDKAVFAQNIKDNLYAEPVVLTDMETVMLAVAELADIVLGGGA